MISGTFSCNETTYIVSLKGHQSSKNYEKSVEVLAPLFGKVRGQMDTLARLLLH